MVQVCATRADGSQHFDAVALDRPFADIVAEFKALGFVRLDFAV